MNEPLADVLRQKADSIAKRAAEVEEAIVALRIAVTDARMGCTSEEVRGLLPTLSHVDQGVAKFAREARSLAGYLRGVLAAALKHAERERP